MFGKAIFGLSRDNFFFINLTSKMTPVKDGAYVLRISSYSGFLSAIPLIKECFGAV